MSEEFRPRLGRGLAALIGDSREPVAGPSPARGQRRVPIEFLRTNPRNPRKTFNESALDELAASIKEKGILQPILARPIPNLTDAFEIIAGERRWRAAQRAGLHEVPVIAVEATDQQALELAIIENVQRSDLNALEEAMGYDRLGEEFGYTQADLAQVIGKSRSHVANTLRLLKLPENARRLLGEGKISAGHARALLACANPETLANRIVDEGLSVRDAERMVQNETEQGARKTAAAPKAAAEKLKGPEKDADTLAMEKRLAEILGVLVEINLKAAGGEAGELRVAFKTLDQLEFVCQRLTGQCEL